MCIVFLICFEKGKSIHRYISACNPVHIGYFRIYSAGSEGFDCRNDCKHDFNYCDKHYYCSIS